jgi:NhaA family Na+:H+ antiporter
MDHQLPAENLPKAQFLAERAFTTLQRFLHVEAISGGVLLIAAVAALVWANSPFAHGYHALWHLPLSIGLGEFVFVRSLHFWINDALMTVFFLVVGIVH